MAVLLASCGGAAGDSSAGHTVAAYNTGLGASNRYVATNGSDSNAGTQAAPFKTIQKAAQGATPGTMIHVADGTYEGGFQTKVSGTAAARISFVSETKWGARIVPPANSSSNMAWDNRGSYVDINGFEIDGAPARSGKAWLHGIYTGGSYSAIKNNHVHDIANSVACNSMGGSAIGVDGFYDGVENDVLANLVHDIGPANCAYVQGIYMSTSGSVQNNAVYRIAEAAIHLWHDANTVLIANNTVSSSGTGIIVGGGDYYYTEGPDDNTLVINNIVYDNQYGISEQGSTGKLNSYKNNLSFQNSAYNWDLQHSLPNTASVNADPKFVWYTRTGTPDFHLTAASPAIASGTSANAPALNLDGMARASTYNIGAY